MSTNSAGKRIAVRTITHVHTSNSNGCASEMDPVIGGNIRRIMGKNALPTAWSECFTPVSALLKLLQHPVPEMPVGLVVVTDHMNSLTHRLPGELLRAAAEEPRLAAGCELTCVERDLDGMVRRAPEVLVYGGAEPVAGSYGAYFGIPQSFLDLLYRTCRAPGSAELQTRLVLEACSGSGIACALAHPFDGHELSVGGMVDLISRARFVEVVNGGFPPESTRFLQALVSIHNRAVRGYSLAPDLADRWPLAASFIRNIQSERRGLLHPWGGSDAHSHSFDRVVIRFLSDRPDPTAGDFFRAMVEQPVEELLLHDTFRIEGQAGTAMSVVDDVLRIIARNLWRYRTRFLRHPFMALRTFLATQRITRGELGKRDRRQGSLKEEVARTFPAEDLLPWMEPGPVRFLPAEPSVPGEAVVSEQRRDSRQLPGAGVA